MPRIPLPAHFVRAPFLVSDADTAGIGRDRLRGPDVDAVWGVRSVPGRDESPQEALFRRCRMFALRMPPTAVFSHSTAALLMGVPLPFELERARELHIAAPSPHRAPHAAGIRGHRLALREQDLVVTRGIRHTSPARTWCDLASQLQLLDLVAAGDFLLHGNPALASPEEFSEMLDHFGSRRGAALLRQAEPLLDGRAESRPESKLRVIYHLGGLPEPRVNHVVVMTDAGPRVRTDLCFDFVRLYVEYQGDYHRTREQWRKDMTRRTRLEAQGGYVLEINADDLRNEAELVARTRALLVRLGWRP
ncbi:MAG: hypothetical protein IR160_06785 [Salinibacterium sp.]|nr:hypothetical protein [Salinibacterium sp.]MBF0672272.1 hypothetical protein [Salinibacterium sp.]